jgi:hypothetical protein
MQTGGSTAASGRELWDTFSFILIAAKSEVERPVP